MAKNKSKKGGADSLLKLQNKMSVQQVGRNNIRKNNMNYTNINKNKGK